MAGFYYFLPHVTQRELVVSTNKLNRHLLAERGLAEVLADCKWWPRDVTISEGLGPEGISGVTLYVPPAGGAEQSTPLQFDAKRQTWMRVDDGRWIGWLTGDPPAPEDLLRRGDLVSGRFVTDEAGRGWRIPVARAAHDPCGYLPQNLHFDAEGNSTGRVKPQHEWLWRLAGEVWDCLNYRNWKAAQEAGEDPECQRPEDLPDTDPPPGEAHDEQWLRKAALDVLGVNYRLGFAEVNALAEAGLPLLDEARVQLIAICLIDLQFVREVQKKTNGASIPTAANTSASPPGEPAGCQATAPPTASCE